MPLANVIAMPSAPAPDAGYAFGANCSWHGPLTFTERRPGDEPCCPNCNQPVRLISETGFWDVINRNTTEYVRMMHWSQGRCFPDYDAQLAAFLKAMGGE